MAGRRIACQLLGLLKIPYRDLVFGVEADETVGAKLQGLDGGAAPKDEGDLDSTLTKDIYLATSKGRLTGSYG